MKRDYQRSNFAVTNSGAVAYCYADEHREMLRRINELIEHREVLRLDAMCRGGAPTAEMASALADTHVALNSLALAIIEQVLAEGEAKEAAGRKAVIDGGADEATGDGA